MRRFLVKAVKQELFFYLIPIVLLYPWFESAFPIPLENGMIFGHYLTVFPNTIFIFTSYYVIGRLDSLSTFLIIRKNTEWFYFLKLKISLISSLIYLSFYYLCSFSIYQYNGLILNPDQVVLFISLNTLVWLLIGIDLQDHTPQRLFLALFINYFFHYVIVNFLFY